MRRLITAEVVAEEFARGRKKIAAPAGEAIITPGGWSKARELEVTFDQSPSAKEDAPRPAKGAVQRTVDASGAVVVRGSSVQLGRFDAAGNGKNVGLLDVVTGKDRSPMTAGFMAWAKADSFPWTLDYDEVDCVLEGTLQLTIGGRVLEAKEGDVVFIPKGSKVTFGTPSRVRVFYVTYPAVNFG